MAGRNGPRRGKKMASGEAVSWVLHREVPNTGLHAEGPLKIPLNTDHPIQKSHCPKAGLRSQLPFSHCGFWHVSLPLETQLSQEGEHALWFNPAWDMESPDCISKSPLSDGSATEKKEPDSWSLPFIMGRKWFPGTLKGLSLSSSKQMTIVKN